MDRDGAKSVGASLRLPWQFGAEEIGPELVERTGEPKGGATETSSTSVAHNGGGQAAVPEVRKGSGAEVLANVTVCSVDLGMGPVYLPSGVKVGKPILKETGS